MSASNKRLNPDLTFDDLEQIRPLGITPEQIHSMIERFIKGVAPTKLIRPCGVGDGIMTVNQQNEEAYIRTFDGAMLESRTSKFVPASGAATRMFQSVFTLRETLEQGGDDRNTGSVSANETLSQLRQGIKQFAFFNDLKAALNKNGMDMDSLISEGDWLKITDYIINPKGLNYSNLPKGLIKFHSYPKGARTGFEEHLVEALDYTKGAEGICDIHFTVSPEHEDEVRKHLRSTKTQYVDDSSDFDLSVSVQKPSTDTLAVDIDNNPARDARDRLIFRPGGHGALLENLNDLRGDVVFIKNIDNIAKEEINRSNSKYKKIIGGVLISLQSKIFDLLTKINSNQCDGSILDEGLRFCSEELSITIPQTSLKGHADNISDFLVSRLNRPIRVCGVVKNEGEPGGGPFWVEGAGGEVSLQIVESAEVDLSSNTQRDIWNKSAYFNPVDIVCGLRNFMGSPFDLMNYRDPSRFFISRKSFEGSEIKALELPGLWNGGMSDWNTVFVEVPIITFNPVKIVFDLLRKEHL